MSSVFSVVKSACEDPLATADERLNNEKETEMNSSFLLKWKWAILNALVILVLGTSVYVAWQKALSWRDANRILRAEYENFRSESFLDCSTAKRTLNEEIERLREEIERLKAVSNSPTPAKPNEEIVPGRVESNRAVFQNPGCFIEAAPPDGSPERKLAKGESPAYEFMHAFTFVLASFARVLHRRSGAEQVSAGRTAPCRFAPSRFSQGS